MSPKSARQMGRMDSHSGRYIVDVDADQAAIPQKLFGLS
jgi:hypothetical protein